MNLQVFDDDAYTCEKNFQRRGDLNAGLLIERLEHVDRLGKHLRQNDQHKFAAIGRFKKFPGDCRVCGEILGEMSNDDIRIDQSSIGHRRPRAAALAVAARISVKLMPLPRSLAKAPLREDVPG